MRREGSGTGTGIRVSLRLTSLLFLLGEERCTNTGRRAVFAVSRIFFIVNNGHWFCCFSRGTLLVLVAITLAQLTPAHGCSRTSVRAATYPFSSFEEFSFVEFSGRSFRKCSRILRYLARQWNLLRQFTVSVWQQRQVRTVQTVPGPARGDPTGAVLGQV